MEHPDQDLIGTPPEPRLHFGAPQFRYDRWTVRLINIEIDNDTSPEEALRFLAQDAHGAKLLHAAQRTSNEQDNTPFITVLDGRLPGWFVALLVGRLRGRIPALAAHDLRTKTAIILCSDDEDLEPGTRIPLPWLEGDLPALQGDPIEFVARDVDDKTSVLTPRYEGRGWYTPQDAFSALARFGSEHRGAG